MQSRKLSYYTLFVIPILIPALLHQSLTSSVSAADSRLVEADTILGQELKLRTEIEREISEREKKAREQYGIFLTGKGGRVEKYIMNINPDGSATFGYRIPWDSNHSLSDWLTLLPKTDEEEKLKNYYAMMNPTSWTHQLALFKKRLQAEESPIESQNSTLTQLVGSFLFCSKKGYRRSKNMLSRPSNRVYYEPGVFSKDPFLELEPFLEPPSINMDSGQD